MVIYRSLLGLTGLTAAIVVWFFLEGLADGSVSSFNITLWLGLLAVACGVPAGGAVLHANGKTGAAKALLALVAVPAVLAGLFFLLLILTVDRWN